MKSFLQGLLIFLGIEAAHFLLLTGALCGLGFFTLGNGDTPVTFRGLLWTGVVSFWLDGYGPLLLLCLVAVITWAVVEMHAERLGLEKRRENLDREAKGRADKLLADLRPKLEEEIQAATERDYAMRQRSLYNAGQRLGEQQRTLEIERRELEGQRLELYEQETKVETWKRELHDLRQKAADGKEKRVALKQRVRWASGALAEQPPNVGLALRHLKKAEKI